MKLTYAELICLASAILLQIHSPHIPEDCDHYKELDKLYTKLVKEISHAENNRKEGK
jgi:hypothetical protein